MTSLETRGSDTGLLARWVLPAAVTVLALADGIVHFALDFVLFRGNFFGGFPAGGSRPGPRPGVTAPPPGGGPPQLPLPLNEMFLLNFIGYVVLVLLFWLSPRWLAERRWLVNVLVIAYAMTTFVAWWMFGRPNPMGLGYISKGLEVVLIAALAAHIWVLLRGEGAGTDASQV